LQKRCLIRYVHGDNRTNSSAGVFQPGSADLGQHLQVGFHFIRKLVQGLTEHDLPSNVDHFSNVPKVEFIFVQIIAIAV